MRSSGVRMQSELPIRVAENVDRFTGRAWLLPKVLKWLDDGQQRFFLVTGDPGTGKSMLLAWLAGFGRPLEDVGAQQQLARVRNIVKASHFCEAGSRNISPKAFAESMASQLLQTVSGFSEALTASLGIRPQIAVTVHANTVHAGGKLSGIERLDLGALDNESASFDRAFAQPLTKLYASGYREPMLLLVDALDEALTYTGVQLPDLLCRLADLPADVRILATSRDDPRVLKFFRPTAPVDLVDDAPRDVNDVRTYAADRLRHAGHVAQPELDAFADRLSTQSKGIFLYAAMVLDQLPKQLPADLESYPLPDGLAGLYHQFLNRELGNDEQRWFESYEPLLGVIAVAQGEGLTTAQLTRIIGKDVRAGLRAIKQYVSGDLRDGPFRLFHKSFADFLLADEENVDFHIDAAAQHRRIADAYRHRAQSWSELDVSRCDPYGWAFLTHHVAVAGGLQELEELVNSAFLNAKMAATGRESSVVDDLRRMLLAARDAHNASALFLWGWAYVAFRDRIALGVKPELLPLLVRAGMIDKAIADIGALDSHDSRSLDERLAARQELAWALANQGDIDRAVSLFDNLDLSERNLGLRDLAGRLVSRDPDKAVALLRDSDTAPAPATERDDLLDPPPLVRLCQELARHERFVDDALWFAGSSGPALEAVAIEIARRDLKRAWAVTNTIVPSHQYHVGFKITHDATFAHVSLTASLADTNPPTAARILEELLRRNYDADRATVAVLRALARTAREDALAFLRSRSDTLRVSSVALASAYLLLGGHGGLQDAVLQFWQEWKPEMRLLSVSEREIAAFGHFDIATLRSEQVARIPVKDALALLCRSLRRRSVSFDQLGAGVGTVASALSVFDVEGAIQLITDLCRSSNSPNEAFLLLAGYLARFDPAGALRAAEQCTSGHLHLAFVKVVEELGKWNFQAAAAVIDSVDKTYALSRAVLAGRLAERAQSAEELRLLLSKVPRYVESQNFTQPWALVNERLVQESQGHNARRKRPIDLYDEHHWLQSDGLDASFWVHSLVDPGQWDDGTAIEFDQVAPSTIVFEHAYRLASDGNVDASLGHLRAHQLERCGWFAIAALLAQRDSRRALQIFREYQSTGMSTRSELEDTLIGLIVYGISREDVDAGLRLVDEVYADPDPISHSAYRRALALLEVVRAVGGRSWREALSLADRIRDPDTYRKGLQITIIEAVRSPAEEDLVKLFEEILRRLPGLPHSNDRESVFETLILAVASGDPRVVLVVPQLIAMLAMGDRETWFRLLLRVLELVVDGKPVVASQLVRDVTRLQALLEA